MRKSFLIILSMLILLVVFQPVAVFAADSEEPIRVGWVTHPGLQEMDDGVYSGYTYDYLMQVANYTGWTYEFIPGALSDCLKQLQNGEIDMIGGLLYSKERAELFDFPDKEYGQSYKTLFTSQESNLEAYDYEAFNGIHVGMVENATVNHEDFRIFAEEKGFSYTAVMYTDIPTLTDAVLRGEVEAGMLGAYQAEEGIKVLTEFSPSPLYFAVTKDNSKVLTGLNQTINQLQIDNPYLEIELYKKYFASPKNVKLTDAEMEFVKKSETTPIKLGIIPSDAPTTYWDSEKGSYTGIYMDLLERISQNTGIQFEYVPLDLTQNTPAEYIKAGYPRAVAGMLKTNTFITDQELICSDTLDMDALAVAGRKGDDFTKDTKDKTIAIMTGFQASLEFAETYFPNHQIVMYDTLEECMNAVADGHADATVHLESCVNRLLQNPHYEGIECNANFSKDVEICICARTQDNVYL